MLPTHQARSHPTAQCLHGDTVLIHAGSAWPATLRDIIDRRDATVLSMQEASVIRGERVFAYHAYEPTPLYRLTTYTGRSIEVGAHHPFLTRTGWRPLSALDTSDAVAVVAEYPELFGRGDTDGDLIKLLAYLTAAGTSGDGTSPVFVDVDARCDFEAAVNAKGDACEAVVTEDGSTQLHVHGRFGGRSKVLGYLELVGVHGVCARDMYIPDFVFGLKRDKLRVFLSRLFTCDAQFETSGRLTYRTGSVRMARQVQHLLARFGVVSLLRGLESGGELEAVDLAISTKDDVVRFIDEVGFVGEKAHRAEEVRAALYRVRTVDPSPGRLGPILFDRVIAVEATESAPAFDLAFDGPANFVANDFVVRAAPYLDHGSAGRRADVAAMEG